MYNYSKLILLLTLCLLTYQQCSQSSQQDNLMTGSQFFFKPAGTSIQRQHLYQFPVTYRVPSTGLQITASSSNLQLSSSNGIDFSIRGSQGPTSVTAVIVLLIDPAISWTSIRAHFLITSRSDFWAGTFSADIYLQQKYSSGNTIALNSVIANWNSNQKTYNVVAQLAGLKTIASTYSVKTMAANINAGSGVLTLVLGVTSKPQIELIFISYIVFQTSAPFSYSKFNPSGSSQVTYQFIGIEQIDNGNSLYSAAGWTSKSTNLLTCVGSNCPAKCLSQQECAIKYGHIVNDKCLVCGLGEVMVEDLCKRFDQINCGKNMYFNGTGCQCHSGHVQVGPDCYMSCGLNAYVKDSQCRCYQGFQYSQSARGCVKIINNGVNVICRGQQIMVNRVCICPPGYGYLSGICSNCPPYSQILNGQCICSSGYTYNTNTRKCQQLGVTCKNHQILVSGVCICPIQLGRIGNICMPCPDKSFAQNGQCVCTQGYTLNAALFKCQENCQANARRNSAGVCTCNQGYTLTGGVCVGACQSNQFWNGTHCVCIGGQFQDNFTKECTFCNSPGRAVDGNLCVCAPTHYPTSTGCLPCRQFSAWNSVLGKCVCRLGYEEKGQQCVEPPRCPPNSNWNQTTQRCDCTFQLQYVINGFCQPCQMHSSWNGSECVCNWLFIKNGSLCMRNCPQNSTRSGNRCICNTGLFLIEGLCVVCDVNSVYSQAQLTCLCRDGWYGSYRKCLKCHSSCASCIGPNINNCRTCPANNQLKSGSCLPLSCPQGQFLNPSNQCISCLLNCDACSSATTCTACKSGFTARLQIVGGILTTICADSSSGATGTTSKLSLSSSVVGNNVIYQGVTIDVLPATILSLDCSICNTLLQVSINSPFAAVTFTIQYVKNSQYWFVVSFNFNNVAFIPNFSFEISIDPQYSSHFTLETMQQTLSGNLGSKLAAVTQERPTLMIAQDRSSLITQPRLSSSSAAQTTPTVSQTASQLEATTLAALFG